MADMNTNSQDYTIDPVDYFDSESIVNKFRDFRDRSKRKFADNYEKMRTDRDFLNGETQWTKADGRHVSDKRNRMILNIISNSVNAVVNQYSVFPFLGSPRNASFGETLPILPFTSTHPQAPFWTHQIHNTEAPWQGM